MSCGDLRLSSRPLFCNGFGVGDSIAMRLLFLKQEEEEEGDEPIQIDVEIEKKMLGMIEKERRFVKSKHKELLLMSLSLAFTFVCLPGIGD